MQEPQSQPEPEPQPELHSSINRRRLLFAGFTAILAAGLGFAIRGGIFADWSREFGFSAIQLGQIGGAGFTGFCFGIIIGGVLVDKIGYGKLVLTAFALHITSAFITLLANSEMPTQQAYDYLLWGMFVFAFANGTLEAVANPLVATLYPEKRTHYLNILHASWPAGLVLGGTLGALLGAAGWSWKAQLALYLIPTCGYGLMFLGQAFPRSEAASAGLSLGEMFKDVGLLGGLVVCALIALFFRDHLELAPFWSYSLGAILLLLIGSITSFSLGNWLLLTLFIAHALVGALELGTDGWIQNITGNLLTPTMGKWLFVMASLVMFALRFCADIIEQKLGLAPLGLLLASSITSAAGLLLISNASDTQALICAVLIYAIGKTFFWPTMLAVVGDRFPHTGAVAISIMGGIGMMAAGLLGTPGLGYLKDRYTAESLDTINPGLYAEVKSPISKGFLGFEPVAAIDGKMLSDALQTPALQRSQNQRDLVEANIAGDRKTLSTDATIPMVLTLIFLGLIITLRKESSEPKLFSQKPSSTIA